jgi:putative phage-type endonuclease
MYRILGKAADHQQWLEMRRKGIGGSDASAILGCNPFSSHLQVWQEKRSTSVPVPQDTPYTRFGSLAEDYILGRLNERYDELIVEGASLGTLQSKARPWQLANVDGKVHEQPIGLEIKTCDLSSAEWWSNGVPDYYYAQVQHYMSVTGWPVFHVWLMVCPMSRDSALQMFDEFILPSEFMAKLVEVSELRQFVVDRHDDFICQLNRAELKFWESVSGGLTPPTPPKCVDMRSDDEFKGLVSLFMASRKQERAHRDARKSHQDQIISSLGGATKAYLPDGQLSVRDGDWGKYIQIYKY